jgi:hypothetical protein
MKKFISIFILAILALILLRIIQIIFGIVFTSNLFSMCLFYSPLALLIILYLLILKIFKKILFRILIIICYTAGLLYLAIPVGMALTYLPFSWLVYSKSVGNNSSIFVFNRESEYLDFYIVNRVIPFVYSKDKKLNNSDFYWNYGSDSIEILLKGNKYSLPNPKELNRLKKLENN